MKLHNTINHKSSRYQLGILIPLLFSGLIGCSGSNSSTSVSHNATSQASFAQSGTVPLINGNTSNGLVLIKNNGNIKLSDIQFNVVDNDNSALSFSKLTLNNPSSCASLDAKASCALSFTTPSLPYGGFGGRHIVMSYSYIDPTTGTIQKEQIQQVVNYQYVANQNTSQNGSVNFAGGLDNLAIPQGETKSVIAYLYATGESSAAYNVTLKDNRPGTISVVNGFINNQELVSGQVVPVVLDVASQSSVKDVLSLTPEYTNYVQPSKTNNKLQQSKQVQHQHDVVKTKHNLTALGASLGQPLQMTVTPQASSTNFIFSNANVFYLPESALTTTITIVNNGNADSGAVTWQLDSNASRVLSASGTCASLSANTVGSCSVTLSVTNANESSGSGNITFSSGGKTIGGQTLYWVNRKVNQASLQIIPSQTNLSLALESSTPLSFSVINNGNVALESMSNYSILNSSGNYSWTQTSNNCTSTLAIGANCTISGTIKALAIGNANATSASRIAMQMNPTSVTGNLTILSAGVAYSFVASGVPAFSFNPATQTMAITSVFKPSESVIYTLTNSGNADATISSLSLDFTTTPQLKPYILANGTTCNVGQTLAKNGGSCNVKIYYGNLTNESTVIESGVAKLVTNYYTQDSQLVNTQANLNYSALGNDSSIQITANIYATAGGDGSESNPYLTYPADAVNHGNQRPYYRLEYKNLSSKTTMQNFALDLSKIPYGWVIYADAGSTCPINGAKIDLAPNASCNLYLIESFEALSLSPYGGNNKLDIAPPTPSWTTALGVYSYDATGMKQYVNYYQPTISVTQTVVNNYFDDIILNFTISGFYAPDGDPTVSKLILNTSDVSTWLSNGLLASSDNCSAIAATMGTTCSYYNLGVLESNISITYHMNTLPDGQQQMIPVLFSYGSDDSYGYVSPKLLDMVWTSSLSWGAVGSESGATNDPNVTNPILLENQQGGSINVWLAYLDKNNRVIVSGLTGNYYDTFAWVNPNFNQSITYAVESVNNYFSMAVDTLNSYLPVVAYSDAKDNNRLHVKALSAGGTWLNVGGAISDGPVSYNAITILPNSSQIYVAYNEINESQGLHIRTYDTQLDVWTPSTAAGGNEHLSVGQAKYIKLINTLLLGAPAVFYADSGNNNKLMTKLYFGTTTGWFPILNTSGSSTGAVDEISVGEQLDQEDNPNSLPVIAYRDATTKQATVFKVKNMNGTFQPEVLGTSSQISTGQVTGISVSICRLNPCILFSDSTKGNKLMFKEFTGSSWQG
ncbi:MAG: hypothetical protein RLZZ293_160, partial [Pseudomonadota bacterium]